MRISNVQIDVLLLGLEHKLDRSSMGWSYDDRIFRTDPVRVYHPATIKSLLERGLLDANFIDPRLHRGSYCGEQNLDRARHEHSPEVPKFQVWTSALGVKVLKDKGLLPNKRLKTRAGPLTSELRYH
jgi:hypothetical protein